MIILYKGSAIRAQSSEKAISEMRKRILVISLIFGLGIISVLYGQTQNSGKVKEFEFYNSFIFQNGDKKDVYCNVILNIKEYDINSIFESVKEEYFLLNGNTQKLRLRLYESKESIELGDCLGEKVYSN